MLAAALGREDIVNILLQNGADIKVVAQEKCEGNSTYRWCSDFDISILYYAVWGRSPKIVETFIKAGVSVNHYAEAYWHTVLENVMPGDYTIYNLLINAGMNLSLPSYNRDGVNFSTELISTDHFCDYIFLVQKGLKVRDTDLRAIPFLKSDNENEIVEFI